MIKKPEKSARLFKSRLLTFEHIVSHVCSTSHRHCRALPDWFSCFFGVSSENELNFLGGSGRFGGDFWKVFGRFGGAIYGGF